MQSLDEDLRNLKVEVPDIDGDVRNPDAEVPDIDGDVRNPDAEVPDVDGDMRNPDVEIPDIDVDVLHPDVGVAEVGGDRPNPGTAVPQVDGSCHRHLAGIELAATCRDTRGMKSSIALRLLACLALPNKGTVEVNRPVFMNRHRPCPDAFFPT